MAFAAPKSQEQTLMYMISKLSDVCGSCNDKYPNSAKYIITIYNPDEKKYIVDTIKLCNVHHQLVSNINAVPNISVIRCNTSIINNHIERTHIKRKQE